MWIVSLNRILVYFIAKFLLTSHYLSNFSNKQDDFVRICKLDLKLEVNGIIIHVQILDLLFYFV